jgi:hypothetical protein
LRVTERPVDGKEGGSRGEAVVDAVASENDGIKFNIFWVRTIHEEVCGSGGMNGRGNFVERLPIVKGMSFPIIGPEDLVAGSPVESSTR